MRIVYLHGFASSPLSTKAQFFARKFAERGVPCDIPQLDGGNFERMTVSGQLEIVDRAIGGERVTLMGSSLGGYVAGLYAARHSNVERLVLLAPAFDFPSRWRRRYSQNEISEWRREGSRRFYHFGAKTEMPLAYSFVEDALHFEDDPDFKQPALVVHGLHDDVVPVEVSKRFAESHPNVRLRVFDSGHELTDVMDQLWNEAAMFLEFQK